ncbi:MAG TPA: hypothetical protein VFY90_12265, partial [Tepidiformaceae bacterium]|nr:hypothetical protein [Tepidiformaceae bacterium]
MWWRGLGGTLALWAGGLVLVRAILVPGETCEDATAANVRPSAIRAASWIERVQHPDGSYLYEYDRDARAEVPGYNIVRHAGVTMSLWQLAAEGEKQYLAPAEHGFAWMQARLVHREDWTALQSDNSDLELGANALMLAGLLQYRDATGDTSRDDLMRGVARFLVRMQRPDGGFTAEWRAGDDGPYLPARSRYATGEAFWALALMHNRFPDEGWDRPSRAVADYLSLHRDEVENFKFPPWADQWAAYGLSEMAGWGLSDANIAYARSLADRFGFLIRVEAQRSDKPWSKVVHGRNARAAGMGTWVEGLDSLWRIADADPRMADMKQDIADRVACGAGMLVARQQPPPSQPGVFDPVADAWFTEGKTRMDDQQHALSALLKAEA